MTAPSEIDGAALRALVEKATPGPFDHRDGLVRAIRGEMAVPLFEARPVYDPTVKAPTVRFPDGEVIFRAGSHDARHSFAEHQCRENGEALAAILNALPALLAQAETYRDMFEIATRELGYPSILEALEATPKAPMVRMRSNNGGDAWVYQGEVIAFEDDGWTAISDVVSDPLSETTRERDEARARVAQSDKRIRKLEAALATPASVEQPKV